jgi:hypothetical protein
VLVAPQHPFLFQGPDVLEDGDLAGAQLVGQFLHGGRVATQMAIVSNGDHDVELTGSEVHNEFLEADQNKRAGRPQDWPWPWAQSPE